MNEELRKQIHNNLNEKETDDLLEIWETNDRVEWSDLAFEVLQDILTERIGSLPQPKDPVFEHTEEDDEDLEDWEAKLLDDKNQPDFYDTVEAVSLLNNINKVAKAIIVVNIVLGITGFPALQKALSGAYPSWNEIPGILWLLLLTLLAVGIEIAVVYFPLKALAHILRILMEMEFNSRKVRSK